MFNHLWQNLTKNQKIIGVVVLQLLIIVVVAACINWAFQPEIRVEVSNQNETGIPQKSWEGVKKELWYLISNNVSSVTKSDIDDAVIREGTYEETTENEITTARFLLDIDSLKQTYAITVSWSDTVELTDAMSIDCPPINQMKYPETTCYGMYNNTDSLDLYLPYTVDSPYDAKAAPDILIEGNEGTRIIEVEVSTCNPEENKRKALEYLESTPIDLTKYRINYTVNSNSVVCDSEGVL